jgi:hypothetical protein
LPITHSSLEVKNEWSYAPTPQLQTHDVRGENVTCIQEHAWSDGRRKTTQTSVRMLGVLTEIRNRGLRIEGQKCYSLSQSGRFLNLMLYRGCHKVSSVFNRPVDLVAKWISVTYHFMYIILICQLVDQPRVVSNMISFGLLCRYESSYSTRSACDLCDLSVTRSHIVVSIPSLSTSSTVMRRLTTGIR